MKAGFNLLLWTTQVTEEHYPLLEKIKNYGYDGVELPIFGGEKGDYEKLGRVLRDTGLACTAVTIIPDPEHSPISPESAHREGAVRHLRHVIECAAVCGCDVLCGPFHQALGSFSGEPPTEEEKKRAAEVHRTAAEIADEHGVDLAIECLNRFEAYFINTLADTAEHVKRVNHPRFGTMVDTFHANIEEKDPIGCITEHADVLKHVHISENDRGTPGRGHINWPEVFRALQSIGYDRWLTVEAFSRALPDLAAATRVWRDFFPDLEEPCREGLRLIRKHWS